MTTPHEAHENQEARTFFVCVVSCGLMLLPFVDRPFAQGSPRIETLVAVLRPVLPFPAMTPSGEMPADSGPPSKWLVVWPSAEQSSRVIIEANPLHPDTQNASAAAMEHIQAAVVAAERKAQAAYDRAIEELKRTGKPTNLDGISLDDEGIAGERIDAELQLTIDLQTIAPSFEVASSEAPTVSAGTKGVTWVVTIAANTYRESSPSDAREHFRPAESRLYFGTVGRPSVSHRGNGPHFVVTFPRPSEGFAVVLRGNEELLTRVLATADWTPLSRVF